MARTHLRIILEVKNMDFLNEKLEERGSVTVVTLTRTEGFAVKKDDFFKPKVILR